MNQSPASEVRILKFKPQFPTDTSKVRIRSFLQEPCTESLPCAICGSRLLGPISSFREIVQSSVWGGKMRQCEQMVDVPIILVHDLWG